MKSPFLDRFAPALAVVILVLHAAIALWAASKESATADEILYVTGGYYLDRHNDYRIQPENGVLPQRLHGLAALATGAPAPRLEGNDAWRTSSSSVNSYQFFYETGHDHFPMLMGARALNTLFSIGAGLLVFLWARHLGGARAGLIATALYAADPNLLAHAALATSDLAAVFLLLAAASAFWWQLAAPSPRRVAASAFVFGLTCVAKFSAVLLVPVFAVLLLWRIALDDTARRRWLKLAPLVAGAHVAGALAIIWLFHGFRYSGFAPGLPPGDHYIAPWGDVLPYVGWQGGVIDWCRRWHVLPEPFLWGYSFVLQMSRARAAFLAGETGIFGWVSFFPLAFAWKSTLALLAGSVGALLALGRRWAAPPASRRADLARVAPLLVFFSVYWAFALTSHLNIGHRHLLPVYPILYIWVGTWVATIAAPRWRLGLSALLVGFQVAASVAVAPHFLAFFNRAAGGPANGYRLLADSSLDWGQDLPALRDWLRANKAAHPGETAYLSYFGSGEPNYHGITAVRLPFTNGFKFMRTWYEPRPGVYCVSATMLQQVYTGYGSKWTPELEREYQQLRVLEPAFRDFMTKPGARPALLGLTSEKQWRESWTRFDSLRFARLCAHLRSRPPDAMVGYSILIYRLDETELAAALGAKPSR